MAGFDQLQNLVLKGANERVYQLPPPQDISVHSLLELVPLGLYLIRGDNVAIVNDINDGVFNMQEKGGFEGFDKAEVIKLVVHFRK